MKGAAAKGRKKKSHRRFFARRHYPCGDVSTYASGGVKAVVNGLEGGTVRAHFERTTVAELAELEPDDDPRRINNGRVRLVIESPGNVTLTALIDVHQFLELAGLMNGARNPAANLRDY